MKGPSKGSPKPSKIIINVKKCYNKSDVPMSEAFKNYDHACESLIFLN